MSNRYISLLKKLNYRSLTAISCPKSNSVHNLPFPKADLSTLALGRSIHTSSFLWKKDDSEITNAVDNNGTETSEEVSVKQPKEDNTKQLSEEGVENVEKKTSSVKNTVVKKRKKRNRKKKDSKNLEVLAKEVSMEMSADKKTQEEVEMDIIGQLVAMKESSMKIENKFKDFKRPRVDKAKTARKIGVNDRLNIFKLNENSVDAVTFRKRPADQSAWTATDWYNELEDEVNGRCYDMPYPSNAFQEQIVWTEEGKLWSFPVDNEEGVSEIERDTPFHEHIFLNDYVYGELGWRPVGAVKSFIEGVAAALSLNPHLSVAEKREHIAWFHSYFTEKDKLLQALELSSTPQTKNATMSK